ncbi:hypothetical protein ACK8HH_18000 [Gordonia sp. LUNF6]|nr:hypothetical protein [Gordonia sihwensis]WFN95067.1 hypothetical protein P5P27_18605 [Gordonia sihwensis]
MAPLTTGHIRIRPDFEGHSTQRPLPVVAEVADAVDPARHPEVKAAIEDRIRSALNIKADVELIGEGTLKRPDHVKVAPVERDAGAAAQ